MRRLSIMRVPVLATSLTAAGDSEVSDLLSGLGFMRLFLAFLCSGSTAGSRRGTRILTEAAVPPSEAHQHPRADHMK